MPVGVETLFVLAIQNVGDAGGSTSANIRITGPDGEKTIETDCATVGVGETVLAFAKHKITRAGTYTIAATVNPNGTVTEWDTTNNILTHIGSPIFSVPGIGKKLGAIMLAEIGDFSRFDSPDKILAFAGCSPSTYQSGQLYSSHAKMEKRGSRYLRYALLETAKKVCTWEPTFAAYLRKKLSEGKHYNVAISHAAKKLVRLLYHLEITGDTYRSVS